MGSVVNMMRSLKHGALRGIYGHRVGFASLYASLRKPLRQKNRATQVPSGA